MCWHSAPSAGARIWSCCHDRRGRTACGGIAAAASWHKGPEVTDFLTRLASRALGGVALVSPGLAADWAGAPWSDSPSAAPVESGQPQNHDSPVVRGETRPLELIRAGSQPSTAPVSADAGATDETSRATEQRRLLPPLVRTADVRERALDVDDRGEQVGGTPLPTKPADTARVPRRDAVSRLRLEHRADIAVASSSGPAGARAADGPQHGPSMETEEPHSRREVPGVPAALTPVSPRLISAPDLSPSSPESDEGRAGRRQPRASASDEPNEVHITIGRVEVRAATTTPTRQAPTRQPQSPRSIALDDYLRQREGRRS